MWRMYDVTQLSLANKGVRITKDIKHNIYSGNCGENLEKNFNLGIYLKISKIKSDTED